LYRLVNVLVAIFSPLLAKEPASLCAVNFLLWDWGPRLFFTWDAVSGLDDRSFVVALIPWLWPISYGFGDYTSTPVMALDAGITGALHIALAMSIVFALDPGRRSMAILAGLSIGVAIGGAATRSPSSLSLCLSLYFGRDERLAAQEYDDLDQRCVGP